MTTNNLCLIIIDGWGISSEKYGNAIANATTPIMDKLCSDNWQQLTAHGLLVGIPEGQMGNSEVGHLNIGAGRVVNQDIVRINNAVKCNLLADNANLKKACEHAIKASGRLHLCGLVSDGGVHSHIDHMLHLAKLIKFFNVPQLFIQFFADGRDSNPTSGVEYIKKVLNFCEEEKYGELATIIGRFYAMDRDQRWTRIRVCYDALIGGYGASKDEDENQYKPENAVEIVKQRYDVEETDEFMKPIILSKEGRIRENDTLLFFNYRSDRMRELTECLGMQRFKELESDVAHPDNLHVVTMTQYKANFPFPVLFSPIRHTNILAEVLANKRIRQFHCAETEKYPHVTYFFNGGSEVKFNGEERFLVNSPKVPTYDLKPEMSVHEVANKVIEQIETKKFPFVMCNLAPPDMVGHSGNFEATVKACEYTDIEIGRIQEACKKNDYILLVTADHGNAEKMINENGRPFTAHTCFKVPFVCSSPKYLFKEDKDLADYIPSLRDVAPTILYIMGLEIPKEMDGKPLLYKKD